MGHSCPDDNCSESQNLRAVFLHLAIDAASSILIAAAATAMHFMHSEQRFWIDPSAAIATCVLTLWFSVPLVRDCADMLLPKNPLGPEGTVVLEQALASLKEVVRVDQLRVWQHASPRSLYAMVHLTCAGQDSGTLRRVKGTLAQHGVGTSAVEILAKGSRPGARMPVQPYNDCEGCDDPTCGVSSIVWAKGRRAYTAPVGDVSGTAAASSILGDEFDNGAVSSILGDEPDDGAISSILGDEPDTSAVSSILGD